MPLYRLRRLFLLTLLSSCSTFHYGPVGETEFKSDVKGKITFEQIARSIKVQGQVNGLLKFQKYKFRVYNQGICLNGKADLTLNISAATTENSLRSKYLESPTLIISDEVGRAEISSILNLSTSNFESKNIIGKLLVIFPIDETRNSNNEYEPNKDSFCSTIIEKNTPLQIKADELFALNLIN